MINEEKLKLVKKEIRRGVPEGEIKAGLRLDGYSEEDIKDVFKPHKYDMRKWYLIFSILFFIIGVFLFSILVIAGSAIMFSVYYNEKQRVNKQ